MNKCAQWRRRIFDSWKLIFSHICFRLSCLRHKNQNTSIVQSWEIFVTFSKFFSVFVYAVRNRLGYCHHIVYEMSTFLRFLSSHITQFRLNISPKSNIFLTGIALVRDRNFTNLSNATMLHSPKIASQSRCMSSIIIVKHDHKKFFIEVDGLIAFLKYDNNNGVMHITHTRVPTKLNGHGIGKILSKVFIYPSHLPFLTGCYAS